MYLDYFAIHKRSEMLREAEQHRLARTVLHDDEPSHVRFMALNALGQQLIRLGVSLTRTPQSQVPVIQPECVACA